MWDSDPLPSDNYIQELRVDWLRNISDVCFCLLLMLSLLESGQHDTFPLCGAGVSKIVVPVSVSLELAPSLVKSGKPWYDSILTFTVICLLYCQLKTWTNRNTRNKQKASSLVPVLCRCYSRQLVVWRHIRSATLNAPQPPLLFTLLFTITLYYQPELQQSFILIHIF